MALPKKIKQLPQLPGVYIMRDKKGSALYIGKAFSLRERVLSHFRGSSLSKDFLSKVADIDFVVCDSEAKALILENALIKEEKPRYNILLRDDKSFPWVEISKGDFPWVRITRRKKEGFTYFGPYPQVKLLKKALELIRRVFPFRSCLKLPKKECLYYHLSLCPAPCIGKVSKEAYSKNIRMISLVLEGRRKELMESLRREMVKASQALKFEEASLMRDRLSALASLYGATKEFKELVSLKEVLGLEKIPWRIEAIDISNFGDKEVVGSIVVFKEALPLKSEYRRYKIRGVLKNDLERISQVLERRTKELIRKRSFPDLVIVDGGRAQVDLAYEKFKEKNLIKHTSLIAISKKNEEVWFPQQTKPLRLSRTSPALILIQRLRDEAHRFAYNYHIFLRKKNFRKG